MAVTMPYKLEIMPYLDGITPMAHLLGAVNTVIPLDDGRIIGDNTDWVGPAASPTADITYSMCLV